MLLKVDISRLIGWFLTFKWVPVAALISFSSTILVAIAMRSIAGDVSAYSRAAPADIIDLFGVIVLAPIIETLLLSFLVVSLSELINNMIYACIIGALLISVVHGIFSIIQAFLIFIPFIVFCTPFFGGQIGRKSLLISSLIHSFHNSLICIVAFSDFIWVGAVDSSRLSSSFI